MPQAAYPYVHLWPIATGPHASRSHASWGRVMDEIARTNPCGDATLLLPSAVTEMLHDT